MRVHPSHLQGARTWCVACVFCFGLVVTLAAAQAGIDSIPDRALSNQDVIDMVKSGLSPRAIILRIRNSPCQFDSSATGLEALRAANVPYKVLVAMMQAPKIPAPVKGHIEVVLPDSTPVRVALDETLDTTERKPGYIVYFRVLDDIRIRGLRVIAKGARARGRLLDSRNRSHSGEPGALEWTMLDVVAVDGQRVPLRGGSPTVADDLSSERLTVAEGTEFLTFIYGLRKVNVPPPVVPSAKNSEVSRAPNSPEEEI